MNNLFDCDHCGVEVNIDNRNYSNTDVCWCNDCIKKDSAMLLAIGINNAGNSLTGGFVWTKSSASVRAIPKLGSSSPAVSSHPIVGSRHVCYCCGSPTMIIVESYTVNDIVLCDTCIGKVGYNIVANGIVCPSVPTKQGGYNWGSHTARAVISNEQYIAMTRLNRISGNTLMLPAGHASASWSNGNKVIAKAPEGKCKVCTRPNDKGVRKCWHCETLSPC